MTKPSSLWFVSLRSLNVIQPLQYLYESQMCVNASDFKGSQSDTACYTFAWFQRPEKFQLFCHFTSIAHDRSKEFHWKFNRPVATKMIQLQNPLLRFHKTTKGNFLGEDFQISPTISFLDDSDSLAQIMPYGDKRSNPWPLVENNAGDDFCFM